ncbi:hypothetical protein DLM75_19755 [Leptospira stimsonii]|uniref:Uncharacterized protein n=1 Tax=Leptospira stimsonii TaxID=2202203 RepID=A0A396YWM4_9LEPT|nr:hypothetical protein DLM75_19755 [Leptospira stimsonii]
MPLGARRNAAAANFRPNNEAQIHAFAYQNDRIHRRKSFYKSVKYFRVRMTLNFALWRSASETSIPLRIPCLFFVSDETEERFTKILLKKSGFLGEFWTSFKDLRFRERLQSDS